jgi:hypothetical protein
MIALTDKDIAFIQNDIKAKGVTVDYLIDELTDHICCIIEPKLENGIDFKAAYKELTNGMNINTYQSIQYQTLLSTNLKFQNMKKTMFVSGVFGTLFLLLGVFCKLNHFPLAGVYMLLGSLAIVFSFLPLFFYITYKEGEKKNIFLSITGYLTVSVFILGALFRIMHWPWTHTLILIGQVLLVVAFLPAYLISVLKKANETKTNIIYVIMIVGIGVATLYMSSSVRLSKDKVDMYDSLNQEYLSSTQLFKNSNDSLIASLEKKENYTQNKQVVEQIKSMSLGFHDFTNSLKLEMINAANKDNGTISDFGAKDNFDAYAKVMQKDDNGKKLKNMYTIYKKFLLTLTKDENQKQIIISLLNFEMFADGNDELYGDKTLIVGIATLSELQKNMQIAEYEVLKTMNN